MKILYLDCGMGAAGDMLSAALLELLPDPDAFVAQVNALGLPGVHVAREKAVKCGVTGTRLTVTVRGEEERSLDHHGHGQEQGHHSHDDHEHHRDHEHERHEHGHHAHDPHGHDHEHHGHDHRHSGMDGIGHIVRDHLDLPPRVKDQIMEVYSLIARAESQVHGVPVDEVHFHEVGAMDAVADIAMVCMLMDRLAPDQVVCSPVRVGTGQVRCAHGVLPVPAPAAALLLQGVPIYGGDIQGELCTPTGAALLKRFVTRFGDMPVMRPFAVGYGCGQKDFPAANCVRAMLGGAEDGGDEIVELSCNVDDMTGEELGFAMERLFAGGALDVYTVPIGMKKSRPGTLVRVMCAPADREALCALLFRHTTTLGVRECALRRHVLARECAALDTPLGPVRRKRAAGYGVSRQKYEFEDLAAIARARNLSLREAAELLEESAPGGGRGPEEGAAGR